jgi:hypothetical protein
MTSPSVTSRARPSIADPNAEARDVWRAEIRE